MAGYVVCAACGARIKADRQECLRCGEKLVAVAPAEPSMPWWDALGLSQGRALMLASAVSFVLLGAVVYVWQQTAPEPVDDVARPAGPPPATPAATAPDSSVTPPPSVSAHIETSKPSFEPATFLDSNRLAGAAFSSGNFEAARASYEQSLAKRPDNPEALNALGQALVRLGKIDEAIPRFERAIELAPDKWTYHFNLAHAVGQHEHWDRAAEEYRKAAVLFPTDYATQYNLAMALHKKGDDQAAIPEFEKAIQLAPGEPSFHVSLGISFEKVGRTADAVREYRQYLEMAPAAPNAASLKQHLEALGPAKP